jgi:TonB-dependent Receptor Plug Domain
MRNRKSGARTWFTFGFAEAAIFLMLSNSVWAQAASPTPSPVTNDPAPTDGSQLSTVTVSGVLPNNVLPTANPVSSVFGDDMPIQDTPRSVSVVSQELLKTANILGPEDFMKVAPSTYSNNQWGGANMPMIRGQMGEVFQNGMERTTRSDGLPMNFNSVESMDIITGPASSVYGPDQYTGGYINWSTKQPYFDGWHGSSTFLTGYWDTYRWTEDIGGPLIPNVLAFRLSYQGENSGSYYNNVIGAQSTDVYFALTYTPSEKFTLKINTEFFEDKFNEPTGWNRPTQQLISDGLYYTGEPAGGPSFLGVISPTGLVPLSPSSDLVAPGDSDYGKDYNLQLEATYNVNDNFYIVNRILYEYYYQRDREDAERWNNYIDSNVVQDRLEFHIDYDLPFGWASGGEPPPDGKELPEITPGGVTKNSIIAGVAFKYVEVTQYEDFFNEYLNGTDLTENPANYPILNLFGVVPIPGIPALYGTPAVAYSANYPNGIPGTLREHGYEASWFVQDNVSITNRLNLLVGGRLDLIADKASDPLAPDGFTPASDSTSQLLYSGNVSLTYKTTDWMTNYFTAEFNESFEGSYSGGFAYLQGDGYGKGILPSNVYHYENVLYEAGAKFDLLNHKLFVSVAGYYQEHNFLSSFGTVTAVRTDGAELVATYQPNKNFYTNFSLSYINAIEINPGTQQTYNVYDAFAPPYGTGVGSPNFISYPPGHYRQPGLPHWLINGIASYTLDCGLGASIGFWVTSPQPTSELQNVWIPWQYELDAGVFYKHKNWEVRLDFLNITNRLNFTTGGSFAENGNDLIVPGLPFHIQGTVTIKF